jgi:hypothetical protein
VDKPGRLEPVTLLLLLEWLERSRGRLGKEQTDKLIELYVSCNTLPVEMRQSLKLLNGLSGGDGEGKAALESLPLVMELDSLLRNPSPEADTLASLTLSLLSKKHNGNHNLNQDVLRNNDG